MGVRKMIKPIQGTKDIVKDALVQVGAYLEGIDDDIDDDTDIQDYIQDSVQFISFIVLLEENLNITIPDELLTHNGLASLNSFCFELENIISIKGAQ